MSKQEKVIEYLKTVDNAVFWEYVSQWYDVSIILDEVNNWNLSDAQWDNELKTIKTLIKKHKNN